MSDWIKSTIENFSYPGVFFLMLLETVFPPIPSELVIPLAGFVSTQGELTLTGVIVAGTLGSVFGATILYYFAKAVGPQRIRRWCDAHGHWVGLSGPDLDRSTRWFKSYGASTVLFTRLVPGVRSLISIPAGVAEMSMPQFLIYTTIGSAFWTAALAFAGRALGKNYQQVEHVIGPVSTTIIVGLVLWLLIRGFRQRRAKRSRT